MFNVRLSIVSSYSSARVNFVRIKISPYWLVEVGCGQGNQIPPSIADMWVPSCTMHAFAKARPENRL